MTTTDHAPAPDTTATTGGSPLDKPLHPAHPDAPQQPILVADQLTGTPTWIYPNPPAAGAPPRDPWPGRLISGGVAVSMPIGVAGLLAPQLATLTGPCFGVAAVLGGVWLLRSSGGRSSGTNVSIRIDNRGR